MRTNPHRDERPEPDPILQHLEEVLGKVTDNYTHRQYVRASRGDAPLPGKPYITVTLETEHRTYTGRIFDVHANHTSVDMFNQPVTDPDAEFALPARVLRADIIIAAHVAENPDLLPVELGMHKDDLDAHVETFLAAADAILGTGPDRHEIDDAQRAALVQAAEPVSDLIFKSEIGGRWERFTRAISAREGYGTRTFTMQATDKRLNKQVVTTDPHLGRTGVPLSRFLTHDVPVEFLYTETHKVATDAYAAYVKGLAARQARVN